MKSIVVVCSYHHGNTEKVARRIAEVLDARVVAPEGLNPAELADCDVVGFGSGIYDAMHHKKLLDLADRLPRADGKRAFLFSTDGTPRFAMKNEAAFREKMRKDHEALREKLLAKGYAIAGEFNCAGFNTNSFLRAFGGFNRGRPDARELGNR
ncbi:MAG: flavodoxin [Clostridiales bacterium]|nr:flavodoxin [Clostridiales bacterium]